MATAALLDDQLLKNELDSIEVDDSWLRTNTQEEGLGPLGTSGL